MRQVFLILLALIICSEVAINFNSALLPNLEESFHISYQTAQTTIASGLFALGLSGIIYGGISDYIGHRPIQFPEPNSLLTTAQISDCFGIFDS